MRFWICALLALTGCTSKTMLPGDKDAGAADSGSIFSQDAQMAPPTEVYARPATSFVAEFVGLSNRLEAEVRGGRALVRGVSLPLVDPATPEGRVMALVRPEAVTVAAQASDQSGPLVGSVIATTFLGATSRITVDLGDTTILAQLGTAEAMAYPAGTRVSLTIREDPILVAQSAAGSGASGDEPAAAG